MANRAQEHSDHITPLRIYLSVGLALFILTALTVTISKIHLGPWNAIVALGIASFKGLLVALFFMHLLYDKKIYMIIVSVALVMLAILIALTMADILRRGDINGYEAVPIRREAKIYDPNTGLPLKQGHAESPAATGEHDTASISTRHAVDDSLAGNPNPEGMKRQATGK
ncbi:MAG: hypothetical protein A2W25_08960 [candidate division Zixibacteria bacterium RBG_16_53_22]|nr:MAG: hypothetical protein A2W25_08960 [candidate division Zixibacteria bacterium RBG_16_53_22]